MDQMDNSAETIRCMWRHEDTLTSHRLQWFSASQALLFAALAIALNKNSVLLKYILAGVGIGTCLLAIPLFYVGSLAKRRLFYWWKGNRGNYSGPPVVGFFPESNSYLIFLAPANVLPFLFMTAWTVVAAREFP
jgi:hypothetical protein